MINEGTTFKEIKEHRLLGAVFPYLIGNGEAALSSDITLADVEKRSPTWAASDMAYGLRRLKDIAETGRRYIYNVYSDDEISKDSKKADVKLIHFPAEGSKKFAILAAGGGYGAVCSLVEAFPAAAKLNEQGISAFCLNYRVGGPMLMPKPMDDLAAAYRYISMHAHQFKVDPEHYAVGGFSAGGHLAGSWGTKSLGFRKYGMNKPELLFLVYPFLSFSKSNNRIPDIVMKTILIGCFGEDYSHETCKPYNVDENVDADYPPAYIVHAKNDDTVPYQSSQNLADTLLINQIRFQFELHDSGGHGFGLGESSDAAGWLERAIRFWDSL